MFIFSAFPDLAECRVIAVLLAAAGIASRGLKMAAGRGGDPDIGPGRRDGERSDAGQIDGREEARRRRGDS